MRAHPALAESLLVEDAVGTGEPVSGGEAVFVVCGYVPFCGCEIWSLRTRQCLPLAANAPGLSYRDVSVQARVVLIFVHVLRTEDKRS